ncbi:MAG: 5-methyltetrahydrofolate--homocysteine methyltransferase [Spartobacteria bacterium]|nr:5-methyltetrahydrofolate--homocysteine methyltransferase [Spartobacteria bacterium]
MNRKEFKTWAASGALKLLDGATGTQLALKGMPQGVCPEQWVLENPQSIIDIQKAYHAAGSQIVYTCTFGCNRLKLEEFGLGDKVHEMNRDLARLSRQAMGRDGFCFGDMAPTGQFVEPFGDLDFDDAVAVYKEQVAGLLEGGVDGFVIETMMDIQEARAALIAIRETCDLAVMVSMTYEDGGRTLTGTDPLTALITLQSLGADAVGCNCSTGPEQMLEVIRSIKPCATVPLLAKPNAGMPKLKDGKTVFDMDANEFASYVPAFIEAGVNLLGGCCGTAPSYIAEANIISESLTVRVPEITSISAVSSARQTHTMRMNEPFSVVGERINPTGKKALQAELRAGSLQLVKKYAADQAAAGAAILDVNMGLSGIDEKDMMHKSVSLLSKISALPLCIDSSSPEVVEKALRIYPGRALLNSINAEKERLEKMLPIAAKYGAMFIILPLNDKGIPTTVEERKSIVTEILSHAAPFGYEAADVVVDGLVMTVSSNPEAASVTLDLIEWCSRGLGVNTICGLSNVSFGLPQRPWANAAFLTMAISRGLSMAIANPSSDMLMNLVFAGDALNGRDSQLRRYISRFSNQEGLTAPKPKIDNRSPGACIFDAVLAGDKDDMPNLIQQAVKAELEPSAIVDDFLIPGIEKVGQLFDDKKYFLPQLIMSADAMRAGFTELEPLLQKNSADKKAGPVVILATVKGDIHDIGKNIVALMLRNYGFTVVDLGKNVSAETIVEAARQHDAKVIGLSALMTTTMTSMIDVVELVKKEKLPAKIMIGGAVVDQNYADEINAHGYSADAMEAVRLARSLTQLKEE